ncbi:hypothetical protein [Mycolicibacterium sp.]|uniref:DUF7229 domain-containing protein n=1 Tax=Mycolicibacterium sp. TaxID=2320850 RepID=UPI0025ED1CC0|nr:hypothetical protein [Mycolicibacterium sp.]
MSHSVNTSYAVIVLGDRETAALDDLAEKAAEQGAFISEVFSFDRGEAVSHDLLTCVEPVIAAMVQAISTRTDIWLPFPMPDLGREEHIRRLSLVLQRHGLNLLMGRELEPCTTDGGFNPIDFALRQEVKIVDELSYAVISAAGITTLDAEIERALDAAITHPGEPMARDEAEDCDAGDCDAGDCELPDPAEVGEKYYSTSEVARFFGRSAQWVYWAMRTGVFTQSDGTVIEPLRIGKSGRRRFTVPVLRDMARACYRRGIVSEHELLNLLSVLARAEGE